MSRDFFDKAPHFMPAKIAHLDRIGRTDEARALSAQYNNITDHEADGYCKLVNRGALALLATTVGVTGAFYLLVSQVSPMQADKGPAAATYDVAWENQARYDAEQAAAQSQLRDYNNMYSLNP